MKVFKCANIDVINDCRRFFKAELPSEMLEKKNIPSLTETSWIVKSCVDILTFVYKLSLSVFLFFSFVS